MAEPELRNCPFCGGEAKYESSLYVKPLQDENGAYVDYDEMYYWERTYCTECGAEISSESDDDEEEITIAKWNKMAGNRWIPVEDALPEIGYNVLVTRQTESNARYTRIASRQDDCWMDSKDEYGKPNPHQVIAWMPMPDAYEPPKE